MGIVRRILYIIPCFMISSMFSQEKVTGEITDDNGISLGAVTVVNMSTDEKVTSNYKGQFSIYASSTDELRFVKAGYERVSRKAFANGMNSILFITLLKIPENIEEVKVSRKLSGDLSKDSRVVAKVDKGEIVQQAVGLPQPVGKMREKPAEVKSVLLPMLFGQLNVRERMILSVEKQGVRNGNTGMMIFSPILLG